MSRELDKEIAEKVMGEKSDWKNTTYWTLPHYSTDISAAWQVVDTMINEHDLLTFSIESLIPNSDPVHWVVWMNGESHQGLDLCECICRAALAAIPEPPKE